MKYKIKAPKALNATINLPSSKSISNRALIIHAMTGGKIQPCNLSDCDDTEVIINALRNMPEVIDIKAAGTAMRFMTAYLSASAHRSDSQKRIETQTYRRNCIKTLHRPHPVDHARIWSLSRMDRCGHNCRKTSAIPRKKVSDRKRLERIFLLV